MVILHPDLETRVAGHTACVEGYADFCRQATIHRFEPSEPAIMAGGVANPDFAGVKIENQRRVSSWEALWMR